MKPTTKPHVECKICSMAQDSTFALKRHKQIVHGTGVFRHVSLENDPVIRRHSWNH